MLLICRGCATALPAALLAAFLAACTSVEATSPEPRNLPALAQDAEGTAEPAPAAEPEPATTDDPADEGSEAAKSPKALPRLELPWPTETKPAVKAVVAGTWAPTGPAGFDEQWIDEANQTSIPKNRRAGRRQWRGTVSQGHEMLLDTVAKRKGPAVAYAWMLVTWNDLVGPPEEPLDAVLHLRHRGRIRIYLDGEVIVDEPPPAAGQGELAQLQVPIQLDGNEDILLFKCARGSPELGPSMNFEMHVSTPESGQIEGQIWQTISVW